MTEDETKNVEPMPADDAVDDDEEEVTLNVRVRSKCVPSKLKLYRHTIEITSNVFPQKDVWVLHSNYSYRDYERLPDLLSDLQNRVEDLLEYDGAEGDDRE
jgi:hypothetical protein